MRYVALSMVVVSLLFMGCGDEKKSALAQAQKVQMPPLPVKAYEVKFEKATFSKSYSAILKPSKEVDVIARVSGVLERENFVEGSYVKKGDILYEIQKNEYKASLDGAKAALLKAEANFNKMSKEWIRADYLFKNSAISEQQKDELLYAYDDAKAEKERSRAALENAQIEYDYTTIKAPISGVVGISSRDEGSLIDTQNSLLTTITALDTLYAEFSIPSSDAIKYISQIKNGAKLSLKMGSKMYDGEIDFLSPKLDIHTDTLLVRAKVDNSSKELIIGSYVEVILGGFELENVASIPQNALLKTPDATMLYLIDENSSAIMRSVEIAHEDGGVAMISSGVKEGDKIVISNIAKLKPNSKVSIMSDN